MGLKIHQQGEGRWAFRCPGCNDIHSLKAEIWTFNGDLERPTFSPSVLVKTGHHAGSHRDGHCWCTYNAERKAAGEEPAPFSCGVCHSFVRDGQIQFLGDCTHALAGQTVELPDWETEGE